LLRFFQPESVVIIGVSIERLNLGQIIVRNNKRIGFPGRLYGVGKQAGEVDGVPVFASIEDLPETPDVAVIITPAASVPELLRACAAKGIRRVVVESGGFSEFESGRTGLEQELLDAAEEHGLMLMGPNCVGTVDTTVPFMMPFAFFEGDLPSGPVSIISQSGGVGDTYMRGVSENHIFFRQFVSVGNKLQLDEVDFLRHFLDDSDCGMVLMYLESIARGRALFDLAQKSEKPIVLQKSNRTEEAARIAQSHTAALSSSDEVVDAACRQSAMMRVEGEDELLLAAKVLSLPPMRGRRVAVLSRSGGHAVISADACADLGFEIVRFSDGLLNTLRSLIPGRVVRAQNPMDLGEIFDYTLFARVLEAVLASDEVDGVIFNHLYQASYEAATSRTFLDAVTELVRRFDKPVSMTLISGGPEILEISRHHPYPTFTTPLQATRALSLAAEYHARRQAVAARGEDMVFAVERRVWEDALAGQGEPLLDAAFVALSAVGLRALPWQRFDDPGRVPEPDFSGPYALKLLSKQASHKSEQGGVALELADRAALVEAAQHMAARASGIDVEGYLLQAMAPAGEEFIVGGRRDPSFGPVVMVGWGGIYVELLADRALRLAPVSRFDAEGMLAELKAFPLIQGIRGRPALDAAALIDCIGRVASLFVEFDDLQELDLNPVILHPAGRGLSIVDARITRADGACGRGSRGWTSE